MSAKTQSLARNSLTLIFARVVVNISGIVQAMILTRPFFLSKSGNGTYSQVMTIVGFSVVLALGLPESITFFISRASSTEEKRKKQAAIMTLGLLLCAMLIGLTALADPLFARMFDNEKLKGLGVFVGVILAGNIIQSMFQNTSIVLDHVRDAARMSITYSVGNVLVCSSLFFYRDQIHLFILILAAYNLFMMLLRLGTIMKYYRFKLRPIWEKPLFAEIFSFSLPLCLSSAIGTVSRYMDRLVIGLFHYTPEQFAEYAQGARELPYSIVTGAIIAVLMPKVIKNFNDGITGESIALWKKGVIASAYLIFFAIGSNILLSREIILVLYGNGYLPSQPIFIVYTLLLVSRITYWGMFLQAMKKPKIVMYVSIFSLASNMALNFLFVQIFGMIGAAISAVTTSYASVCIYVWLNCKHMGVKVVDFVPFKKVGQIVAVNVAGFILFGALKFSVIDKIQIGESALNNLLVILSVGGLWAGCYALVFRNDLKRIVASLKQ